MMLVKHMLMSYTVQRVANIGPQAKFPVPPGILNPNGNKYVLFILYE